MKTETGISVAEVGDIDSGGNCYVRLVSDAPHEPNHLMHISQLQPETDRERDWLAEELESAIRNERHAEPGLYCGICGMQHCTAGRSHDWGENGFCIYCGADGHA